MLCHEKVCKKESYAMTVYLPWEAEMGISIKTSFSKTLKILTKKYDGIKFPGSASAIYLSQSIFTKVIKEIIKRKWASMLFKNT